MNFELKTTPHFHNALLPPDGNYALRIMHYELKKL